MALDDEMRLRCHLKKTLLFASLYLLSLPDCHQCECMKTLLDMQFVVTTQPFCLVRNITDIYH